MPRRGRRRVRVPGQRRFRWAGYVPPRGPGRGAWNRIHANTKKIRKILDQVEEKEVNVTAVPTATNANTWGAAELVNVIAQGDAANTRDGNKVVMKSIQIRAKLAKAAAETSISYTRVLVVYDRKPLLGAIATGTEILTTNTTEGNIESYDKKIAGRFKVLHDKVYYWRGPRLGETAAAAYTHQGPLALYLKVFIPNPGETWFNGAASAHANYDKGEVFVLMCNDGSSETVTGTFQCKVKFTDI